ncbi:uncharacterized protein [Prorops nasuta]|uniref:uncharacterized protein n=1 Tax=Prorops nasuta TaxID=863751 RepID=UPI0034CEBF95
MNIEESEQSPLYSLDRFLLKITGCWTSQSWSTYIICRIFMQSICIYSICVQVAALSDKNFELEKVMNSLPGITPVVSCLLTSSVIDKDQCAGLWRMMKEDWEESDRKEEETKIKMMYAKWCSILTKLLTYSLYGSLAIFLVIVTFYEKTMDIFIPLEEPRNRTFPFEVKHFFDESKHYYLAMLQISLTLITGFAFGLG